MVRQKVRFSWSAREVYFAGSRCAGILACLQCRIYRNPLEFANGPYSARAIEQKTATVNPAKGNLWAASFLFSKSRRTQCMRGELAGPPLARPGAGRIFGSAFQRTRARCACSLDSPAVLCAIHRLRQHSDFCPHLVALLLLQPALWSAIASGVRGVSCRWGFLSFVQSVERISQLARIF